MSEDTFVEDELLLAHLKSMNHSVLPLRYKSSIKELAERNDGAMVYLILAMCDRIYKLEQKVKELSDE